MKRKLSLVKASVGFKARKTNTWISPSRLCNFAKNNTLEDWLILNHDGAAMLPRRNSGKEVDVPSGAGAYGRVFETELLNYFRSVLNISVEQNITNLSQLNNSYYDKLQSLMISGVPIIYQALLIDNTNKTRGVVDFLVRSDHLCKIFREYQYECSNIGCKFSSDWHYVVMDAKFSGLTLCAEGVHIRNSDSMKYYKTQLYHYNYMLGKLQEYEPPVGFIVGTNYQYESRGVKNSGDSLSRPGGVEFGSGSGVDSFCADTCTNAV